MLSESELPTETDVSWSVWAAALVWFAGVFGSGIWFVFLQGFSDANVGGIDSVPMLLVGQIPLWLAYGLGPLAVARHYGGEATFNRSLQQFNPVHVGVAAIVGVVTQIIAVPLVYWPLGRFIDDEEIGEAAESLIGAATTLTDVILLFIMIVLIAPVVEELFYRGLLLPAISKELGSGAAIVLSSIWFAAAHFQVIQFAGLLAVGLILAVARVHSRSLLPAIALHMTFNGVTFGVLVSQLELV